MDGTQTINPRDILSYLGRDYVVEGVLSYQLPGHSFRLARAVDGDVVLWVELLADEADGRLLVLTEVRGLATEPPIDARRHRAAGDLHPQIEHGPNGHVVLYGESVHKGMIDVLPGK